MNQVWKLKYDRLPPDALGSAFKKSVRLRKGQDLPDILQERTGPTLLRMFLAGNSLPFTTWITV